MIYSAPPSNDGPQSSRHINLHTLRGTQPGLIDPSQPSRLLRFSNSQLSFASFDPKTALAEDPTVQKLENSANLPPPKRIVIETTPKGASFWRFVPRAKLEEGAQDEGVWPRVIEICGEKVQCYQEQWEIYKLDPNYHCTVYPWPRCSVVTRVELRDEGPEPSDPYSGKRSRWSSPEMGEPGAQKKARSRPPDEIDETDLGSDEDEDEVEVEEMIVDESFSQKSMPDPKFRPIRRERLKKARLERWEKNRMAYEKEAPHITVPADASFSMRVDSDDTSPSQSTPSPTEDVKRKGDPFLDSDSDSDQMSSELASRGFKRARTSPKTRASLSKTRKRAGQRHVHPEKRRLDRLRRHTKLNQHQETWFTGFTFVPADSTFEAEEDEAKDSITPGEAPTEASSREAEIAESIRKLRELEKDRPLWETQRKQREARERAEEQERVAKAERRRKEEEEQRLRQQREAAERAQQEAERLAREEELRQREIRQRRQRQRWESGPWTTHRALERYRMLSDEFDAAKFASGQSITFHDIPWPVLQAPSRLTVEDVDWSAVETFFATVKLHMRLQDYKEFVERSHRRFHPDRWRARKIWIAVADEVERGYLEVAANTVAQAITPIWRATRER